MTVEPFELSVGDLVLDQLTEDDIPLIYQYCQDPLFEKYLTVPWPYSLTDAEFFVRFIAHSGWVRGDELIWAIRHAGEFTGVISMRAADSMIGYWMGSEHRGAGHMSRAATAVIDWVFESGWSDVVTWEARIGNVGSLAVARKLGFQYTGVNPASTPSRDGSAPDCWRAELHAEDTRAVKAGWPDLADFDSP